MDCAEIRNGFVAGRVPAGPEVEAHLKECPHCSELFEQDAALGRRLAHAVLPETEAGDLFSRIDQDLKRETGLRAGLRALPTRARAAALLAVAVVLLGWQLVFHLRPDLSGPRVTYAPMLFWGLNLSFAAAFFAGAVWLLRGASAKVRSESRGRAIMLGLLLLPALVALVAPLGSSSAQWLAAFGQPGLCFTYGGVLVVPVVALYWLFERRDHVPWTALVSAGALAGIAANLLLQAHCPSEHLGHLLLGHASIGVAWALALVALSRPFQRSR